VALLPPALISGAIVAQPFVCRRPRTPSLRKAGWISDSNLPFRDHWVPDLRSDSLELWRSWLYSVQPIATVVRIRLLKIASRSDSTWGVSKRLR
jgi:hypothetical protein